MKKPKLLEVPKNVNVRYYEDGSFGIPRRNREIEAIMDRIGERLPNQLRWWPIVVNTESFVNLEPMVVGRTVCIIAKGPSLDHLCEEHFDPEDVIITLNEAIHKVESLDLQNQLIAIQQDRELGRACWTKRGAMLVPNYTAHVYYDHPNLYTFTQKQLPVVDSLTASVAIALAGMFKAKDIKMFCFDAMTHKDLRYAKVIGHPSSKGGAPERFFKNSRRVRKQLEHTALPHTFITPTAPAQPSSYTQSPSPDNPPEHHASVHTESLELKPDTED